MRQSAGDRVFSPTDLNAFLACPHLTALELAVKRGEVVRPHRVNLHAELIRRKGEEHERSYLERLSADGREITQAEGRAIVNDRYRVDHKHRDAAAHRRMNQRRKQATSRESQESQSAPTSRPANTSIRAPEVA